MSTDPEIIDRMTMNRWVENFLELETEIANNYDKYRMDDQAPK